MSESNLGHSPEPDSHHADPGDHDVAIDPAPPTRVMAVTEAAEQLATTTSKLYELVARHTIPSVRIS